MDPFAQALKELTAALESLGVRYAVGGSLASSTHGLFRATEDGDLIADVHPFHLPKLAAALGSGWYADVPLMETALRAGRAFNLIHMGTALKFDVFPASTEFHTAQLDRAQLRRLRLEGAVPCRVTTAEDILLAKLRWYCDGGEISDRQWNDIVGLISANQTLDHDYLQRWAQRLGVTRLLEKAQADAQVL
ncbi:MAG TPA: hypothetical protein VMH28_12065 [Candidatus Acidoferrales bacterium]|nr:hypothetical protein [Candidatus Acidoferrales bacterium]